MIKELSENDFEKTFGIKMTYVTETAVPVVDIWPYVEVLVKKNVINKYVYENILVDKVYRNDTSTFDHVLLPTKNENVFVVIVVDIRNRSVYRHMLADLNKEYGM